MEYSIRDPIHRTINFSEVEKKIIDHPFVQRLRYIRQLGLSYLVYPGAVHDRFSHAVGAMHVAGRVFDAMLNNSSELWHKFFGLDEIKYFRHIVRLAALTHDLGHPPFSHMSEKFMGPIKNLDLPRAWFRNFDGERVATHEDYSVLLVAALAKDTEAGLSWSDAQLICSLIHHEIMPNSAWQQKYLNQSWLNSLLHSLISSELDCDRMDYLLRDAYYTGVAYGEYDIDHLISNLGVVEEAGGVLVRTIDVTAVRAFEDFLLARYHMFLQVYLHKTNLAFDYFLEQARVNGEINLLVPTLAEGYAKFRDFDVLERIFMAAEDPKNIWSKRLARRWPAKLALAIHRSNPDERALFERTVSIFDKHKIPYFAVTSKQYLSRTRPFSGASSTEMLVRRKILGQFVYEPIEHYSALLQKYNEIIDITHLFVLPEFASNFDLVWNELPEIKKYFARSL